MSDIITTIAGLKDLVSLKGVATEVITTSEQRLGLSFADDYVAYLKKYGVISADSIELTGIIDSPRLNVVDVTLEERISSQIPQEMYVIEDTGIEGILVLQNGSGEVFKFYGSRHIKKIYDNLSDYLRSK
jgi:hypothetical protein